MRPSVFSNLLWAGRKVSGPRRPKAFAFSPSRFRTLTFLLLAGAGGAIGAVAARAEWLSRNNRDESGLMVPVDVRDLETGDVVLLDRKCTSYAPWGCCVCWAAKALTDTPWDHIGIVIKGKHAPPDDSGEHHEAVLVESLLVFCSWE